jgi:hypothetical protein
MIVSFFIALIISVSLFFISGSFASTAFAILIIIIGTLSSFLLKKEYREKGLKLFYIVFSVYTIFALFHYLDVYYFNNFIFPDEFGSFLPWAHEVANNSSLVSVFKDSFDKSFLMENRGYMFYIGSIAYFAQTYLDGYNELLLFLSSVLFGSLSSLVLYRLLIFHTTIIKSFKYSLLFALFSASLLYSFTLLRDIHITFFYLCGFVIISNKYSLKGLVILILLTILTWNFRYEHGVFFIIFILYYFYIRLKRYKLLFILLGLIASGLSSSFVYENISNIDRTLNMYTEFTEDSTMSKDDSLGKIIWTLPTPIKEVGIILNSQLQPFPSWKNLEESTNFYSAIISLPPIFYSFFWFTIIFGLIKWFVFKKKYKLIDKDLKLLGLIALVFIVSNVANLDIRRIICVYPILYLIYVIINTKLLTRKQINTTLYQSSISYLALIIVYLIVKFI